MKLNRPVFSASTTTRAIATLALGLALPMFGCGKKGGDAPADTTSTTSAATPGNSANGAAAKPAAPAAAPANAATASDGLVFSCNTGMGLCSEWHNLSLEEFSEAKQSCNDPGEVFSKKPCNTAGVIATCDHPDEKIKMFISKSVAVPSLKEAKELCDDGKFTALAK